jgi:hypothetical protein
MQMPILVRSRNDGKTFELRVTHPHLEKPVYRTFDTRLDAERSGSQALVQLARHEVPVWLQQVDNRPLKTIGEAIWAYSLASAVPASTERLLETLEGDLGAHKLDEVTYVQDFAFGNHPISRVGTHLKRVLAEP